MVILTLLTICLAAPWAETPALREKAIDPSFTAILSIPETVSFPFADIPLHPRQEREAPLAAWSWMGRSLPVLSPRPVDSSLELGFGNEVGDPLFREPQLEGTAKNRNPAMWASLPAPSWHGLRGSVFFDQTDHFSDAGLGARTLRLGAPVLTDGSPRVRRAWFGENLPCASFLGASLSDSGTWALAGQSGWAWLSSPLALDLQAWRVHSLQGDVFLGPLHWSHAQGIFERADTLHGRLLQTQGRIDASLPENNAMAARIGLEYLHTSRRGDVSWHPDEQLQLEPWVAMRLRISDWTWSGFHQGGNAFYRLHDTLAWSRSADGSSLRLQAVGQWTDRPGGTGTARDSTLHALALDRCTAIEQSYLLQVEHVRTDPHGVLKLTTAPWLVLGARAFRPDGFDSRDGWISRFGSTVSLPDPLWGWKVGASGVRRLRSDLELKGKIQFDPILGDARREVDYLPSLLGLQGGFDYRHPSGLSVEPSLVWRSSATIRHRSRQDWNVPAHSDADLWITQELFQGKLRLSCAALNILSTDPVPLPNAGEDRFRLLVRLQSRFW